MTTNTMVGGTWKVVPQRELVRYRRLAWALVHHQSKSMRKVLHLSRIVKVKWLNKERLQMMFLMYQSTCSRLPSTPYNFAKKCWHNRRKPLIICTMKTKVNRLLMPTGRVKKTCRPYQRRRPTRKPSRPAWPPIWPTTRRPQLQRTKWPSYTKPSYHRTTTQSDWDM
ncbi:hypothetical protein MTO96_007216 [Rhipicephalus appendiculatus]